MSNNNNNNNIKVRVPTDDNTNILITSALPYVNNVPHLGNIIGCVLSGDVYSRFCKLRGYNSIYVCGTDEYGTATETKAMESKVTPKELCDKYYAIHKEIYEWFDIEFDVFGRTTDSQHENIAQEIFLKNLKQENILNKTTQVTYCKTCDRYLADRFVEGICPHCQYDDARGDQCDGCGQLLNSTELISPKCKVCRNQPQNVDSLHAFLNLSKLEKPVEKWMNEEIKESMWSDNAKNISYSWLKKKLEPRCITRDLKWGTPVPKESGDEFNGKVFYCWFDAPIGYISITAGYTSEWRKWWQNPKNVKLVQFMGKDNVPFHTIMFPASLIGTGDDYTLLNDISVTEYLNYENGKFSKSRGTGVFGDSAMKTGIPPSVWRYYLLTNRPEQSDTVFSWQDFAQKNNSELLANLGNFVNRGIAYTCSKFKIVPTYELTNDEIKDACDKLSEEKVQEIFQNIIKFQNDVSDLLNKYINALEKIQIKNALKIAMEISTLGNVFMQINEPWVIYKKSPKLCGIIIYWVLQLVTLLATIIQPYMPSTTREICEQINVPIESLTLKNNQFKPLLAPGHIINKPKLLFTTIEDEQWKNWQKQFAGKEDENIIFPLRLITGKIVEVNDHPQADSLFVLKINCGKDIYRNIVSGLKATKTKDELLNLTVIILANLKSAKIRGVKSEGMILTAKIDNNNIEPLTIKEDVDMGIKIQPKDIKVTIQQKFNVKKQLSKLKLHTNDNGYVVFGQGNDALLETEHGFKIVAMKNAINAIVC